MLHTNAKTYKSHSVHLVHGLYVPSGLLIAKVGPDTSSPHWKVPNDNACYVADLLAQYAGLGSVWHCLSKSCS